MLIKENSSKKKIILKECKILLEISQKYCRYIVIGHTVFKTPSPFFYPPSSYKHLSFPSSYSPAVPQANFASSSLTVLLLHSLSTDSVLTKPQNTLLHKT